MVRNHLQPLAFKNHIVHMKNYSTSIPLVNDLARMQIWSCGTMHSSRRGECREVIIKKNEETKLKKKGFIRYASYGFLCLVAWFAKRAVLVLTNCNQPIAADETGTVKHWFTEKGKKIQKKMRDHLQSSITTCTWVQWICLTNIAAMLRLSCEVESFGTLCFGLLLRLL